MITVHHLGGGRASRSYWYRVCSGKPYTQYTASTGTLRYLKIINSTFRVHILRNNLPTTYHNDKMKGAHIKLRQTNRKITRKTVKSPTKFKNPITFNHILKITTDLIHTPPLISIMLIKALIELLRFYLVFSTVLLISVRQFRFW